MKAIQMRKVGMVLVTILLLFVIGISYVFADEVDSVANVGKNLPEANSVCARANATVNKTILSYDSGTGLVSFNNVAYSELVRVDKDDFMRAALDATNDSSMGVQSRSKMYNFISKQDTATAKAVGYLKSDARTDLAGAGAWFKPFGGFLGKVFGVFAVFIVVFFGLSIMFDIFYLNIPWYEALVSKGENKKPVLVSRDAVYARKEAENGESGEMVIYMKKRVIALLLTGICLGYLISGKLYDIVLFFIDAFSF